VVIGLDVRAGRQAGFEQLVVADLCDSGTVERVLGQQAPATIFHLAGQSGVAASEQHPAAAFTANAQACWTLLEACRTLARPPEIVVASSNHVYGHQDARPTVEAASLNGTGTYAASKVCTDVIARCYAASHHLPIVVARITNSFGGADPHLDHLIAGTITAVLRGETPVIRGNGTARKAYLYVEDTIDALVCLAGNLSTEGVAGEAFNVVGAEPMSVLDTVRTILRELGREHVEPTVLGRHTAPEEVEELSGEKILARLGWRPHYTFDTGLRRAIEDYRALLSASSSQSAGH
jgi:CDP-glucose 4,6-dehydratase